MQKETSQSKSTETSKVRERVRKTGIPVCKTSGNSRLQRKGNPKKKYEQKDLPPVSLSHNMNSLKPGSL